MYRIKIVSIYPLCTRTTAAQTGHIGHTVELPGIFSNVKDTYLKVRARNLPAGLSLPPDCPTGHSGPTGRSGRRRRLAGRRTYRLGRRHQTAAGRVCHPAPGISGQWRRESAGRYQDSSRSGNLTAIWRTEAAWKKFSRFTFKVLLIKSCGEIILQKWRHESAGRYQNSVTSSRSCNLTATWHTEAAWKKFSRFTNKVIVYKYFGISG